MLLKIGIELAAYMTKNSSNSHINGSVNTDLIVSEKQS